MLAKNWREQRIEEYIKGKKCNHVWLEEFRKNVDNGGWRCSTAVEDLCCYIVALESGVISMHWNTSSLPPEGNELLIKLKDGSIIKAERTAHVSPRTDPWPVRLEDGTEAIVEAIAWAYD